jgi:hypothetical protein
MRSSTRSLAAASFLALGIACPPLSAGVLTGNCVVGPRPAATLLFPYFEVDLADPAGTTTLLAINTVVRTGGGGDPVPTLARVTVWTEWGVPTVAFNLYLRSGDVQTINLRDLFATGAAPVTGPGANGFPGCGSTIGGPMIDPTVLRLAHTGQKVLGSCFSGGARGPNVATGYVTVDTALRCPTPAGGGSETPATGPSYFSTGPNRVADVGNHLWGDWILVTPGEDFANGNPAAHLQADPDAFSPGDYTFYGRYVGFSSADNRRPLPSRYNIRFANGGPFSGGTQLVVWRDTRSADSDPVACGSGGTCGVGSCRPDWLPLGETTIAVRDEATTQTTLSHTQVFDLATQRVNVAAIPVAYTFGWLALNLNLESPIRSAQAWVGAEMSADGRYQVAYEATPTNDLCATSP